MNQLTLPENEDFEPYDAMPAEKYEWVLKKLKPVHMQICALLAQGMKSVDAARISQVTPEYISMLLRQPIIKQEIARIGEITGARLELLFEKSVDVMADAMQNGNHSEKLKAARLQLEATKRIGRPDPYANSPNVPDDRLERLSERLIGLLHRQRDTYNEAGQIIEEATIVRERSYNRQGETTPQGSSETKVD